jgi:hypothetical protein
MVAGRAVNWNNETSWNPIGRNESARKEAQSKAALPVRVQHDFFGGHFGYRRSDPIKR